MAQLGLISFLLLACSLPAWSQQYNCKEVKIESKVAPASEVQDLCFLKDPTYFISEKCADLKCKPMSKLKGKKVESSEKERPGATLCKAIGGIQEEVSIPDSKLKISRCLFTEEMLSISLNLLESWDGKHFTGPSKPLDM